MTKNSERLKQIDNQMKKLQLERTELVEIERRNYSMLDVCKKKFQEKMGIDNSLRKIFMYMLDNDVYKKWDELRKAAIKKVCGCKKEIIDITEKEMAEITNILSKEVDNMEK